MTTPGEMAIKCFHHRKKRAINGKEKNGKELNLENAFGILLVRFRVRTSTDRRLQEFSREIGENQKTKLRENWQRVFTFLFPTC